MDRAADGDGGLEWIWTTGHRSDTNFYMYAREEIETRDFCSAQVFVRARPRSFSLIAAMLGEGQALAGPRSNTSIATTLASP